VMTSGTMVESRVLRRFAPLVESKGTCSLIENKFS
jgi:hypothetical protein